MLKAMVIRETVRLVLTTYLLWLLTGDAAEDGGVGRLSGEDARLEGVISEW